MYSNDPLNAKDWGKCFMAHTSGTVAHIDFKDDWIIDSNCDHHLTGDDSKFSNLHAHKAKEAIVIADNTIYPVKKEDEVVNYKVCFMFPDEKESFLCCKFCGCW